MTHSTNNSANNLTNISTNIELAVTKLQQGDVVAFPTETVYGLGARIDNDSALKKIFSIKERPFFDPLIVHVSSVEQAKSCFKVWPRLADLLANKFWPGPLTLVMTKSEKISDIITSGLESVGVRFPQHPIAQKLISEVGCPLAAPSANKFGKTSPTQAEHVIQEFADKVFVLQGSASDIGIESTVLLIKSVAASDATEVFQLSILRKGAVLKTSIDQFLSTQNNIKYKWVDQVSAKESPGHMKHHYMPDMPFVVCRNPSLKLSELASIIEQRLSELPDIIENIKIIKPTEKIQKIEFLRLSTDPQQAARELYSQLRLASKRNPQVLCYIQMPEQNSEMWESVFDRLYKAASLIID